MKNDRVILTLNGIPREVPRGMRLAEAIAGSAGREMPCGGHGKCGKCRVHARGRLSPLTDAERRHLTAGEIRDGVRLACLAHVLGDAEVKTSGAAEGKILTDGISHARWENPAFSRCGLAVDIGTTTLAAKLWSPAGEELCSAACLNPQSFAGADVISRIEAAMAGRGAELAAAVRRAIGELIVLLCDRAEISPEEIDAACFTGNTAMLHLLTEEDTTPLSRAPFAVRRRFGESLSAGELCIAPLRAETEVYLPPCISAFVGADMACALLADLPGGGTRMLVDIGTNGEMALVREDGIFVCSTAAGPAFEGVGISCGMRGETGAIDRVTVVNGKLLAHTIGGGAPRGICGSGLADAAACLLDLELMDESGCLEEESIPIAGKVSLTQGDVRALQLAKSAISAGAHTLLCETGTNLSEISRLSVAGGFGNYLNMRSAIRIGLLPAVPEIVPIGNAALSGASMLLGDIGLRQEICRMANEAKTVALAGNDRFAEFYMNGMLFGVE
ncbi:MAG: DUF4445 domain-containing protein [Clostridia bacterium]|nr:DUF4445 domain-containing protein [Clostridia bacterium]